jgi:hypothetical protein
MRGCERITLGTKMSGERAFAFVMWPFGYASAAIGLKSGKATTHCSIAVRTSALEATVTQAVPFCGFSRHNI